MSSAKWRPFCPGLNVLIQHNVSFPSWIIYQKYDSNPCRHAFTNTKLLYVISQKGYMWLKIEFHKLGFMLSTWKKNTVTT